MSYSVDKFILDLIQIGNGEDVLVEVDGRRFLICGVEARDGYIYLIVNEIGPDGERQIG